MRLFQILHLVIMIIKIDVHLATTFVLGRFIECTLALVMTLSAIVGLLFLPLLHCWSQTCLEVVYSLANVWRHVWIVINYLIGV